MSLGQWHRRVPTDAVQNLTFRRELLRQASQSAQLRREIVEVCREDLGFYVNALVWQYNPLRKREVEPFILWPHQAEVLAQTREYLFERQEDVVWEKSRYEGATWMALILFNWQARLHQMKQFLMVSHKEEVVKDRTSKDSLFWKIAFIDRHLPPWFGNVVSRKTGFHYDDTDSDITGTSSTERSGVGGRATAILLDEFALQRDDWATWANTRDVGPRLVVSTHYGLETRFFSLCQQATIKKLVIHWTQNPWKNAGLYRADKDRPGIPKVLDPTYKFPPDYAFNLDGSPTGGPFAGIRSPWYDKECEARNSAHDVAMHLDIDPRGATNQFFDPIMIQNLVESYACEPLWVGDIDFDPETGDPRGLVPAPGGPLKLWINAKGDGSMPVGEYAIGGDVSAGTGATPSCLSGGNARTGEKILEYANPFVTPERFAYVAVALCRMFKNEWGDGAFLIWEADGAVDKTFGNYVVKDLGYYRVYMQRDEFKTVSVVKRDTPGWYANPQAKRAMLEDLRNAYTHHLLVNHSREALLECRDFVYTTHGVDHASRTTTNDPSGARENHADRAIADGLMWKGMKELGGLATPAEKRQEEAAPWGSIAHRRKLRAMAERDDDLRGW